MLSRTKHKRELAEIVAEYELKKRCQTSAEVDPKSFSIEGLMVTAGSKFVPGSNTAITVNVHNGTNPYPRTIVEGYKYVHKVVPIGKKMYCLGRLSLDKKSGQLTFGREPMKPFVLQYGTEEEILTNLVAQQRWMQYGSTGCLLAGTVCLLKEAFDYANHDGEGSK